MPGRIAFAWLPSCCSGGRGRVVRPDGVVGPALQDWAAGVAGGCLRAPPARLRPQTTQLASHASVDTRLPPWKWHAGVFTRAYMPQLVPRGTYW